MFKLFSKTPKSKKRSEKILSELGIVFNKNLPFLDKRDRNTSRTSKEIAKRIIALWEVVNNAVNGSSETKAESVALE